MTDHHYQRGSARMFKSDFIEYFSHVHPLTPMFMYGPVILGALLLAVFRAHAQGWQVAVGVAAGYFLWTLFEYWFHRLFFHLRIRGPATARLHFLTHGVHHDYPWDETRLVMPPGISVPLAVGFALLFWQLFAPVWAFTLYAGMVGGYLFYDTSHWLMHHRQVPGAFMRWLRREHMIHHFKESSSRYGVSCPWWDHLFGTTGTFRSEKLPSSATLEAESTIPSPF